MRPDEEVLNRSVEELSSAFVLTLSEERPFKASAIWYRKTRAEMLRPKIILDAVSESRSRKFSASGLILRMKSILRAPDCSVGDAGGAGPDEASTREKTRRKRRKTRLPLGRITASKRRPCDIRDRGFKLKARCWFAQGPWLKGRVTSVIRDERGSPRLPGQGCSSAGGKDVTLQAV